MSTQSRPKPAVISFFAGSGLLDLAFEDEGYEVVGVNEFYAPFAKAYQYARRQMGHPVSSGSVQVCSVEAFLERPPGAGDDVGDMELDPATREDGARRRAWLRDTMSSARAGGRTVGFVGGPPCPDFSVGGKNRGEAGDNGRLSQSYVDAICLYQPDWFLFENVKGLYRTAKHKAFFARLKTQLRAEGYTLSEALLNSLEFGAPQDRDRIFLFGVRGATSDPAVAWERKSESDARASFKHPWPGTDAFGGAAERPADVPEALTVAHWFARNDVASHPNAQHYFTPRAGLAKFKVIAEGDDSRKSYKRLHRHRYSPTVAYGNNEVHLHPTEPRRLSAAEALALQSLPKEFTLPPDMTLSAMFKTIGNGVPYLMGRGVARSIREFASKAGGEG